MNNRCLFRMLVIMGLAVVFGCSRKASDEESGVARSPVVNVKAVPVAKGNVEDAIVVEGRTDAVRKEKIVSPLAGTVVAAKRIEGTSVSAGDTLAVIRSRESQATIDGAHALLQAAKSEAQKDEARSSLELAVSSQNVMAIRSTSDGIVASRSVNAGELVSEGAELFTITDLSSMYFAASIPLQDLPKVRCGERCWIVFPSMPDVEIPAAVSTIEPSADSESQSVKAHLVFEHLRPEQRSLMKTDMFGTARIVAGRHQGVLLVPRSALLRDDETNTTSVVIVSPGSIARTLQVTVGVTTGALTEVAGPGLAEGQLVIIEGNYGLPDSTRVRVTESEKP